MAKHLIRVLQTLIAADEDDRGINLGPTTYNAGQEYLVNESLAFALTNAGLAELVEGLSGENEQPVEQDVSPAVSPENKKLKKKGRQKKG